MEIYSLEFHSCHVFLVLSNFISVNDHILTASKHLLLPVSFMPLPYRCYAHGFTA